MTMHEVQIIFKIVTCCFSFAKCDNDYSIMTASLKVRTGAWNPWKYLKTKVAKSRTWKYLNSNKGAWKPLKTTFSFEQSYSHEISACHRGVEILKYSTCPQASYLKKVTCLVFFGFF